MQGEVTMAFMKKLPIRPGMLTSGSCALVVTAQPSRYAPRHVIPARFKRKSSGPTGTLHRMCQHDSPTVNLKPDTLRRHSGMTAEQLL
jgi:hypothetical protein